MVKNNKGTYLVVTIILVVGALSTFYNHWVLS